MSETHTKDVRWNYEAAFIADVVERGASLASVDENWIKASQSRNGPEADRNPFRRYLEDGSVEGPGMIKWAHYAEPYYRHLGKFIGRSPVVVEIGVWSGGSLRMWRSIFGEGCHVHGVDHNPATRDYADEWTTIHIGDQSDRDFWARFRSEVPHVDILIDDGGHEPDHQIVTMEEMLPHLANGGVYICEDAYHRGNPFFGFVCSMTDCLHDMDPAAYDRWSSSECVSDGTAFQSRIDSVHAYPYMIVVDKRSEPLDRFSVRKHGTQWQPIYWNKD